MRFAVSKKSRWWIILFSAFIGLLFSLWGASKVARGPYLQIYLSSIPGSTKGAGRIFFNGIRNLPYFGYRFIPHNLPRYDLRIDPKDLQFLENNLPKDAQNTLADEFKVSVDATIVYNGISYPVQVRYRGDAIPHWKYPKKSFRLKFDSEFLDGKRMLNLIVPDDRFYLNEELHHYKARKLGLKVPPSRFVVLTINGKRPAVYWEVEQFSKEFLEKVELSGDANLYGENDLFGPMFTDIMYWKKFATDARYQENNVTDLATLINLLNTPSDEYFYKHIFSILDKDSFLKWSVHNALVLGSHQNWFHNVRLFFDPSKGKFVVFPWDVSIMDDAPDSEFHNFFQQTSHQLERRILSNPLFMEERNRKIWEYVSDDRIVQDDFARYDELYKNTRVAFYQDDIERFSDAYFDAEVARVKGLLVDRVNRWRELFDNIDVNISVENSPKGSKILLNTKSLSPLVIYKIEIETSEKQNVSLLDNARRPLCNEITHENEKNVFSTKCVPQSIKIAPAIEFAYEPIEQDPIKGAPNLGVYTNFVLKERSNELSLLMDSSLFRRIIFFVRNEFTGNTKEYVYISK